MRKIPTQASRKAGVGSAYADFFYARVTGKPGITNPEPILSFLGAR
jgi:hypothetical protein